MRLLKRHNSKSKSKPRRHSEPIRGTPSETNLAIALASPSSTYSMGTGNFSLQGSVESFSPSPFCFQNHPRAKKNRKHKPEAAPESAETQQQQEEQELIAALVAPLSEPVVFLRHAASFLRVADLQQRDDCLSTSSHSLGDLSADGSVARTCSSGDSDRLIPHFHHSSVEAPPGVTDDANELWVALDDGSGQAGKHAPIAPAAVKALARFGLDTALDNESGMWKPDAKTAKLLERASHNNTGSSATTTWYSDTFTRTAGPCPAPINNGLSNNHHHHHHHKPEDDAEQVLVWSGKFHHGLYGSDLPCVRAAAIIDMAPRELFDLLVDSSRVKEYNTLSCGREDLLVLQSECDDQDGPFGGVTKVMRSESRPPLLRKTLQFTSLLHGRPLDDDDDNDSISGNKDNSNLQQKKKQNGFLLVSRAVTLNDGAEEGAAGGAAADAVRHLPAVPVLVSEILMGVNVIRPVEGHANQCLLVSINHIRSPMVPMIIAKRIGLQAAVNFVHDLRRCCVANKTSTTGRSTK